MLKRKKQNNKEQNTTQEIETLDIICPFCGKQSLSDKHCTSCGAGFNKEILRISYSKDNDPRTDNIGPLSLKTAKILLVVLMVLLIVAFVVITEMSGAGFSSLGNK